MKTNLLTLAFLLLSKSFFANTLFVPTQYATIQTAITVAVVGDTVLVTANATYIENIDFLGKDIVVRTPNPMVDRFTTFIDGNSVSSVAKFISNETNAAVLEGFTLKNGVGTSRSWWYYLGFSVVSGGGVLCDSPIAFNQTGNANGSSPTLQYLIIENNSADMGGGICAWKTSHPIIKNTIIRNNNATGVGGACVFIEGFNVASGPPIYLENVEATHNTATGTVGGSGIVTNYTTRVVLMNCTVSDNSASIPSGENLFRANGAKFEIHNSIFWNLTGDLLYDQGGTGLNSDIEFSCANNFNGSFTTGLGNITTSPDFVNPSLNDYHITSASTCINVGTTLNAPLIDLDGNLRDAWTDMGAYENFSSVVTVNAALASSDTSFCEKSCIDFFDLSTNSPTSWQWFFTGASPDTSTFQNPTNICYNTYGQFDVKLIACNGTGCDTILIPNFINEFQNPVDSIYFSNDTLWSLPFPSYQWWQVPGGLIPGATNQYFIASNPGNYYCVVDDTIGCIATSNTLVATGTAGPLAPKGGITIAPNPNDGNFQINVDHKIRNTNFKLRITDVLGKEVFLTEINNSNTKVSSFLEHGVYFLEVISNDLSYREKFIVEK